MRRSLFGLAAVCATFVLASQPAAARYDIIDLETRVPQRRVTEPAPAPAAAAVNPEYKAIPREVVSFNASYAPGTIIVSTKERRLYLVMEDGKAMRYGVGVGRPGFEWGGTMTVTNKREWPDWVPPPQMLQRRPDLPRYMKGGPENPLGARAMYLGSSLYRIHGSNEPDSIGQAVSSGCIRMTNDDVMDLYNRVKIGTQVIVMR